eukprot:gene16391-biopygen20278
MRPAAPQARHRRRWQAGRWQIGSPRSCARVGGWSARPPTGSQRAERRWPELDVALGRLAPKRRCAHAQSGRGPQCRGRGLNGLQKPRPGIPGL